MDEGSPIMGLIIFILILLLYLVLFGFSTAIQSINEYELSGKAIEGRKKAKRILKIINDPAKFINTIQIISILSSIIIGIVTLNTYANIFANFLFKATPNINQQFGYFISYTIFIIVIILMVLSLGIIIPKKIAARHPEGWAFGLVNLVSFLMAILTPINAVVNLISSLILKVFGVDFKEENDEVTEEEIMSMVNEGHEQGTILASEAEMITNIFELGDKEAQDIMTNRKNIIAVNGEWTLEETVKYILEENNSRFPIFIENIDNVIGILYFKDAMIYNEKKEYKNKQLKDIPEIIRKAYFIPETRNIDTIFKDMQSEKIHMKMVVDEYGQTAGLITMEDILEEIVGNIFDEYDEIENNIILQEDGTYILNGMTALEDIEDLLGIDYSGHDYDTLNGFLISHLDRIPGDDERPEIIVDGFIYKILGVENKMISQVNLILPEINNEDDELEQEKEEM